MTGLVGNRDCHAVGARELAGELGLPRRHLAEVREAARHLLDHPGRHVGRELSGPLSREKLGELTGPGRERLGRLVRGRVGEGARQHPVADEQAEVEPALGEGGLHLEGLAPGDRLEGGDKEERRAQVVQQPVDRRGPRHEALSHRLEEDEEVGHVLEELAAEHSVGHLVEGLRGEVDEAGAIGNGQPMQEAGGEEVLHPRRGVEQVEGVSRRRRVHDEEVVAPLLVQLVEPLHRDVVLALGEASADVPIERVGQDLARRAGIGGVPAHEGVPGLGHVEHGGVELTLRLHPGRLERGGRDPRRLVPYPLEAESVRQPLGRVDGEHEHPAAETGRHGGGQGGRSRGLADASRTAGDYDLLGGDELLEGRRVVRRGGAQSSSPRLSATWRMARRP